MNPDENTVSYALLWNQGLDTFWNGQHGQGLKTIQKYFKELQEDIDIGEGVMEQLIRSKVTKIVNFSSNIKKEFGEKTAVKFIRRMTKIYRQFGNQFLEDLMFLKKHLLQLIRHPDGRLKELLRFKKYLESTNCDAYYLLELSIYESEIYIDTKEFTKAKLLLLEEIGKTLSIIVFLSEETSGKEEVNEAVKINICYFKHMVAKCYLNMSLIYTEEDDSAKAFNALETSKTMGEAIQDPEEKKIFDDLCRHQETMILGEKPEPKCKKRKSRKRFSMQQSVERLYKGEVHRKDGSNFHFDCVPNNVFIRENAFVRERLYKGGMDQSINRLNTGNRESDPGLVVHKQPFKNYSRKGFLAPENLNYRVPNHKKNAKQDYVKLEQIHSANQVNYPLYPPHNEFYEKEQDPYTMNLKGHNSSNKDHNNVLSKEVTESNKRRSELLDD